MPEEAAPPVGEICFDSDIFKVYSLSKLMRGGGEGSEPRCTCAAKEIELFSRFQSSAK